MTKQICPISVSDVGSPNLFLSGMVTSIDNKKKFIYEVHAEGDACEEGCKGMLHVFKPEAPYALIGSHGVGALYGGMRDSWSNWFSLAEALFAKDMESFYQKNPEYRNYEN